MSSWADEIENESNNLPPPREEIKGDTKIVTEYTVKGEKKVKTVRTYKIEKKMVPKAIAQRKAWNKFGSSQSDKPGPNASTTVVSEEIMMQFITNKEEAQQEEQQDHDKLKASLKGNVKCRICKMDHWTKECPYKDDLGAIKESLAALEKEGGGPGGAGAEDGAAPASLGATPQSTGKYIPPSKRGLDGGASRPGMGDSRLTDRRRDDTAAVRVSNLPEMTQDSDIKDLFGRVGPVARIFLAKDKIDNKCKGFAFVNYINVQHAEEAIKTLNGHRYNHLILNVEWAKPSSDR
eukprot:TRINITY_DN1194_c0_g1_i1.p2 TRINITY_DN1194_c0_g1~~TRINITY_DN1194_c0_g1_i1.p2  ORF type:complete len:292 (-),score=133.26 TRINITY_DN1194_c0_g1_i1:52-927(-)